MADRIQLLLSQRWEDPLASEIPTWIAEASATFALRERPAVVVTPSREIGFYLKSAIMKRSAGFAGIHFWTPSQCRSFLLDHLPDAPKVISRADAELLLSSLAGEFSNEPVIRSVADGPGRLLQTIETLLNSMGNLSELDGELIRELAARFLKKLRESNLSLTSQADHWQSQQEEEPIIDSLLLFGFSGSHWSLWPLLRASIKFSDSATVCAVQPRLAAEKLDQAWIGSWEEIASEARSVDEQRDTHTLTEVVASLETVSETTSGTPRQSVPESPVRYLVGKNLCEQAEAIIRQVISNLNETGSERIGIVFAPGSPVAREMASRLESLKIPHFDGIGRSQIDETQQNLWSAWLAFQHYPRMGELLALLRRVSPDSFAGNLSFERIGSALSHAFAEMQVDDLKVLKAFLKLSARGSWEKVSAFIESIPILPREATLEDFLRTAGRALQSFDLGDISQSLTVRVREIQPLLKTSVRIEVFIRWLESIPMFERRTRSEFGNHPFAKVHLTTYDRAEGFGWSHLILADLNHHHWPPRVVDSPFLHEDTVSNLNAANLTTGSQGEGQCVVKPGKALCLGPNEKRALHYRQWIDLIDSAEHSVTTTASTTSEAEPDRELIPSEYLTRLFFADRGETLSVETFANLQAQTSKWLKKSFCPHPQSVSSAKGMSEENWGGAANSDVQQTGTAFTRRRDGLLPFGKYDFALETPLRDLQLNLAARDWESAFASPAILWLKHALGVEIEGDVMGENLWPKTTGIWVHRWLQGMLNPVGTKGFFPLPDREKWLENLNYSAQQSLTNAKDCFHASGLKLPSWWISGWERAFRLAKQIAEQMQLSEEWKFAATEFTLPNPVEIPVGKNANLRVHGRLDLILSDQAFDAEDSISPSSRFWIIDYKTGSFSKLKINELKKYGKGIQLGLYALALKSLQAADVSASVAHPDEALTEQLGLDEIEGGSDLWKTLCRMQDSWTFGLRGNMQEEFGLAATYPLATLPIDSDTLESKWIKTFKTN